MTGYIATSSRRAPPQHQWLRRDRELVLETGLPEKSPAKRPGSKHSNALSVRADAGRSNAHVGATMLEFCELVSSQQTGWRTERDSNYPCPILSRQPLAPCSIWTARCRGARRASTRAVNLYSASTERSAKVIGLRAFRMLVGGVAVAPEVIRECGCEVPNQCQTQPCILDKSSAPEEISNS